jgi:DNA-binding NtrC family response regulator
MKQAVTKGKFREDLYYRLNVVNIELPPLRERTEDIPLLAKHFLKGFALENQKEITGFSPQATDFLLKHDWPGNVRELENAIERAAILAQNPVIEAADLSQQELVPAGSTSPGKNLKQVEKKHIQDVLAETRGNYTEAARILGISRMTLYNKAKAYRLNVKKIDKSR